MIMHVSDWTWKHMDIDQLCPKHLPAHFSHVPSASKYLGGLVS
jgi:hypothetical protein